MKTLQIISHTYYKNDLRMYIEDRLAPTPTDPFPTHPNPVPYPDDDCQVSSGEFSQVLVSIKDQSFSGRQKQIAKKHIAKKCLSMEQLMEIVSIFSFDKDKLEMIKYLYDYAPYPEKMYTFRNKLSFISSKREFDNFILDKE